MRLNFDIEGNAVMDMEYFVKVANKELANAIFDCLAEYAFRNQKEIIPFIIEENTAREIIDLGIQAYMKKQSEVDE